MKINEFPDNRPWRIELIGSIKRNRKGNCDQLLVALHLTCLKANFENPFSNKSIEMEQVIIAGKKREKPVQKIIYVSSGLLTFLKIGSVWVNKMCTSSKNSANKTITINTENYRKKSISDSIKIGNQEYHALSISHYNLHSHYPALSRRC